MPQAKGRVERLNQTLQSRLPVELRLAGITTIEGANEFLHSYIKKFNAKFSLPIHHTKSVFVEQPSDETINLILAVLNERTVDCGHCIRFQNQHYRMLDNRGLQVHYRNGTKTMVIQAFDGSCTAASMTRRSMLWKKYRNAILPLRIWMRSSLLRSQKRNISHL